MLVDVSLLHGRALCFASGRILSGIIPPLGMHSGEILCLPAAN